ncbi:MAG: tetratricopeptide repeat protein [Spirosomataceae bacterium]
MKKHLLPLCWACVLLIAEWKPAFAQKSLIDSLRSVFLKEKNADKKIELYEQIAREAKERDLSSAQQYADTLMRMAEQANSKTGRAKALDLQGDIAKDKGDMTGAMQLFQRCLALRLQLNEPAGMAQSYNDIGATYAESYQPDSAIYYYLKSIEINEKLQNYSNVASAYSNIGNLYKDQKANDKAIAYLEKALKIRLEHGEEKKAMYTYNNLAVAYGTKLGTQPADIEKALDYSNKGIAVALKYDNVFVAGVIEGGVCHLLNEKKRYTEAIGYCQRSMKHLEEAKREPNLVFPLVNLATAYNALNQPSEALKYAEKGYKIMVERKLIEPLEVYYEEMANAHEKLGHHQLALGWFKKFMALDDSLFQADNVKNLADVETKYQTEKKEKELVEQRDRNFRQRTWLITLMVSILALLIFGYLFYNRYRLRQKAALDAAIIKEQQLGLNAVIEAQEAERKRIAKDLHDGIAQELVALKLGFNVLQNKLANVVPTEAQTLNELSEQLNESCIEVRNISHVMMPPVLEQHGLVPSLQMLLRNSLEHAGVQAEFEHFNLPERLEEKTELGLYRIAQELLNNILKHAQANKVMLQLYQAGNNLIMRIEDNGKSFDFDKAKRQGSMGLLNILSRVSTLGGTYTSEHGAEVGTVSTVRVPVG